MALYQEDSFYSDVFDLYQANDWQGILHLNKLSDKKIAQKLLWVWPSVENLNFLGNVIKRNQLKGIISIGCGCGLLEWLINKSTDLPVIGYEVNKEWWFSKYAMPQFIQLQFGNVPPSQDMLDQNFALLFCYFNCGEAFTDYLKCYNGKMIIIIGPGDGCGRHTNPTPFAPNFDENSRNNWTLTDFQEVKDTKDFIAVYVRS